MVWRISWFRTLHKSWLRSSIFSPDRGEIRERKQVCGNFFRSLLAIDVDHNNAVAPCAGTQAATMPP
jgi:hypothetical protein